MSDLIRTGVAASILGCSRQHIVNLADAGTLPATFVGSHRRVRRSDVERLARVSGADDLRDEHERNRWLHTAIAGELVVDPHRVLETARTNLNLLFAVHPRGRVRASLLEWESLLGPPVGLLLDALTSRLPEYVELRQNSPFAGVLSDEQRAAVLRSFAATA